MPSDSVSTNPAAWPDLEGIEAAAQVIRPELAVTPLLRSELVSRALDADVWLKYETATPIASFKIRGALNAVAQAKKNKINAVVTSSTGNHGQGVAYAARSVGLRADIFLPSPANEIKAGMIKAFGGTVHEVGEDFDIAETSARAFARDHGAMFIDDGEDIDIMQGAGTVALEVASVLNDIDYLLVPLGGGNLTAGAASLAGAWLHRGLFKDKRIVFILTGANISSELLVRALTTSPMFPI